MNGWRWILILVVLAVVSVWAINVPKAVLQAFQAKYPQAESTEWVKMKDGAYRANFISGETKMEAVFNKNGEWLTGKTYLSSEAVPPALLDVLKTRFKDYHLDKFSSETAPNRPTTFTAYLKSGNVLLDVVMDSTGKVLKQLPRLSEKAKKEDFYD